MSFRFAEFQLAEKWFSSISPNFNLLYPKSPRVKVKVRVRDRVRRVGLRLFEIQLTEIRQNDLEQ